jgi:hypothetical protein
MQTQQQENTVDMPPQTAHTIHLVSAELGELGGPAYNYLVFRDHTGADKAVMKGLAIDRKNSDIRALRGVMAPPIDGGLPDQHFTESVQVEIFRGDVKSYLLKMAQAVEALEFINDQNLNYYPEDAKSDSPNSIAHTLIKAMGLEFPEEATHFWAPGHDNIILPTNWRSKYDD